MEKRLTVTTTCPLNNNKNISMYIVEPKYSKELRNRENSMELPKSNQSYFATLRKSLQWNPKGNEKLDSSKRWGNVTGMTVGGLKS